MKCVECGYIGKCKEKAKEPNLGGCTSGIPIEKMGIRTNGDAIRAMDNEELTEFLHNIYSYMENGKPVLTLCLGENCDIEIGDNYGDIKEWLESEVDNG